MFNGNSQKQDTGTSNTINVNSRLYVSYSDTAMIVIGAWNQQISVKIHPVRGINADGVRQYEMDNTGVVKTAITLDNAAALLRGHETILMPAFNEGKAASVTLVIGANDTKKLLMVGTDGTGFYLTIGVNASEDNKVAEGNILTHQFRAKPYYKDLDMATGVGEMIEVPTDYLNFMRQIEAIYDLQPAIAHAITYNEKLRAMRANNGPKYGHGGYGNNNGFQSQQMGGVPAYAGPATTNATSFSDFLEQS